MIDHVILNVTDLEESKRFFAEALAPLGYAPSGKTASSSRWAATTTSACTAASRKVQPT